MELEINEKLASRPGAGFVDTASGGGAGSVAGPAAVSERVLALAEMFGIGLDERHELPLYQGFRLRISRGDVVYITGPSGCGKSVLLRAVTRELRRRLGEGGADGLATAGAIAGPAADDPQGPVAVLSEVDLDGPTALIDRFPVPFDEALRLVSVAGLNDAFLLLRTPAELSDGQRYRYCLAALLAGGARTIVIDEFCSKLDRCTARAVAYRLRRYADRTGVTFVVATAHDDLAEDLAPNLLIRKRSGLQVEARRRQDGEADGTL